MADIPVFWMEPSGFVQVRLRTFRFSSDARCAARPEWGCDAEVLILSEAPESEWREEYALEEDSRRHSRTLAERIADEDPRWPSRCDRCGADFPPDATRQVWADRLYTGAPDGALHSERSLPVGALRHLEWMEGVPEFCGPDGIALQCITPGGEWIVDSEASNCTRKGDPSHKCWIRHGDPRDPQGLKTGVKLHVDKNGDTCAAGAGSIACGSYHGFLHNGRLTSC